MFSTIIMSMKYILSLLVLSTSICSAHTIITYPGWREDNLVTNATFPYGMQWMYPCGGTTLSRNRTLWPIGGGAIAIQPGWFQGHLTAFFYINMGFGNAGPDGGPGNMSNPMVPVFQIAGPTKGPYPGTFCLPQVPLPANAPQANVKIGDNATIQVVEVAVHGASLFNCVDITFADPRDVPEVNSSNCFNSSDIGFNDVSTTINKLAPDQNTTSAASSLRTVRRHGGEEGTVLPFLLGLAPLVLGLGLLFS